MALSREQLDEMDYNDRYDATVAKGRCLECGAKVKTKYAGTIGAIKPVWCADCEFDIDASGAQQNYDLAC